MNEESQCHVDMHKGYNKSQPQCAKLIEVTAGAIDNNVLQLLLVSVQTVNLQSCIQYAMNYILEMGKIFNLFHH